MSNAQLDLAAVYYEIFDSEFEDLYGLHHRNLHIHLCVHIVPQCMYTLHGSGLKTSCR